MAIWHNGELKQAASVDATGAGFLLGWGVFSTVGVKDGRALWPLNHLRRLRRDAARCEIDIPFSDEMLLDGLRAVVIANRVRHGLARLTASRCDDGRWNTQAGTDCSILALETAPVSTHDLRVEVRPAPDLGPLAGVKSTSYLPYFWCWREALRRGFDEAILFDSGGRVVEAARSSVFWVRGEVVGTSPLDLGALDGVGREVVLAQARALGLETREERLYSAELKACDEVFLVSGALGPRSLARVDEDVLPGDKPIFERLYKWWHTL